MMTEKEQAAMKNISAETLKRVDAASEAYASLQLSFGPSNKRILAAKEYADFYGGAFINPDGRLVVLDCDRFTPVENMRARLAKTAEYQGLLIKPCEYSFRALTEIMETLNAYKEAKAGDEVSCSFGAYALMDAENRVVVFLKELDEEHIQVFREQVMDHPAIEFRQSAGEDREEVDIHCGMLITSTQNGTMGYRARYNGRNGFLTAGHVAALDAECRVNGVRVGSCQRRWYPGTLDASWIEVSAGHNPTNNVANATLSTEIIAPAAGTWVNLSGQKSGIQSGTVTTTNYTSSNDETGITVNNLTCANYYSQKGDSGGTIYVYNSSQGIRRTAGIHRGHSGVMNAAMFCKATVIRDSFGMVRY